MKLSIYLSTEGADREGAYTDRHISTLLSLSRGRRQTERAPVVGPQAHTERAPVQIGTYILSSLSIGRRRPRGRLKAQTERAPVVGPQAQTERAPIDRSTDMKLSMHLSEAQTESAPVVQRKGHTERAPVVGPQIQSCLSIYLSKAHTERAPIQIGTCLLSSLYLEEGADREGACGRSTDMKLSIYLSTEGADREGACGRSTDIKLSIYLSIEGADREGAYTDRHTSTIFSLSIERRTPRGRLWKAHTERAPVVGPQI
eukprot:scaffold102586_cov70-Phaeocystis_antarctica.AAC.2